MDAQKAILQEIWRKAFQQDEPLEIPCKTESNAKRMRFALYNAVRGVRDGRTPADSLLREATENCAVGFKPGERSTVVLQKKILTELMQVVVGIVGAGAAAPSASAPGNPAEHPFLLKSSEELQAEEETQASLARLAEKLKEASPGAGEVAARRPNPYYTR